MYQGVNIIGEKHTFDSERSFKTINPSNQEEIGIFPESSVEEVDQAVKVARKAFKSWSKLSRVKRSDYFFKLCGLVEKSQEILAKTISIETGKSLNEANAEVVETLHMLQLVAGSGRVSCGEWMASEIAEKDAYVMRKPKGVVAVISPWNFSCAIGSAWTTGPALLEGNCVVHKPSELTPRIAVMMATLYQQAGFPAGVYNLIHGHGLNVGS